MFTPEIRPFSQLNSYFSDEKNRVGCFVDTSILFSQTYPLDFFNAVSEKAFESLANFNVPVFTNISVRAEFLENHRRVLIAECLIDVLDNWGSELDGYLQEKLKNHKTSYRKKIQEEKSAKLEVSQIRFFRQLFLKFQKNSQNGWVAFCQNFLEGKLAPVWKNAEDELGINFISTRAEDKSPFLKEFPEWDQAVKIMGQYGLGSNDSLILNMFLCSKIPVFLTADLELAEVAACEGKGTKQIFVPDSLCV